MTLGEVFLESMTSGVITEREIAWVASQQNSFARHEEALAIRLGACLMRDKSTWAVVFLAE